MAANARDAAAIVHEESSTIAKTIRGESIDARKNLLVDGTGANANGYNQLIQDLHDAGYHVRIVAIDIPVDMALTRAASRAELKGRWVPENFIRLAYDKIPGSFSLNAPTADEFQLWDNSGSTPRLIWQNSGGTETVYDEEYAKEFGYQAGQ